MARGGILAGLAALWLGALPALAEAPARVVSINLCTDQLAGLLAAPGQLVSVSWLGQDPRYSAEAARIADLPANRGRAEEIWLMEPDLVLAGTFGAPATVRMLEGLGIPVVRFAPITSFDEARAQMREMGALLGREAAAEALVAAFDARLAAVRPPGTRPRVLLYGPLGSASGAGTLPGTILDAAGLRNIAAELGLSFSGRLSLEQVVLQEPDAVLLGQPYGAPARATDLLGHPALRAVSAVRRIPQGGDWSCPTPALAEAVAGMAALARSLEPAP
jgi:iron complex transport system substrate-binding protein